MFEQVDLHIHTKYLKCANETMTIPAIIATAEELGLTTIAITDHLNAPEFLDDHRPIRDDLAEIETDMNVIFGVEVNVTDPATGAISIDDYQRDALDFEFIIGGVHGSYFDEPDPRGIIDLQHSLMLAVVKNPLIDVLVHPWWFAGREFDSGVMAWMKDMSLLPEEYIAELGETALENDVAIEANGGAIFANTRYYTPAFLEDYAEYLYKLASYGVEIAIGSDAHDIERLDRCKIAGRAVRDAGITEDQLLIP